MRKLHSVYIALMFCYTVINAQTPLFLFNQIEQSDSCYQGVSTVKQINGNYIAVGMFNSYNQYSAFFAKCFDERGQLLWTSILEDGTLHRAIFLGNSMDKTLDNHLIMAGEKGDNPYQTQIVLMKMSLTGTLAWFKTYNTIGWNSAAQVLTLANNSFLVIYVSQPVYGGAIPAYTNLMKVDSTGEPLWQKQLGETTMPLYSEQTLDGGFLISGYQYNNATGYDMYVVKTNANGEVEWERTYGTPQNDGGSRAMQRTDGLIVLIGVIRGEVTTGKLYYAHLNPTNGEVLYSQTHQKYDKYSPGSSPLLLPDGSLALATLSYGPPPLWEVAFTVFDNSGYIVKEVPISSGLPGEDYIRDLEPTPDGGFILAGFNYTVPQSSWVVKLGPNGEYCGAAPCLDSLFVTAITPPRFEGGQGGEPPAPAAVYPNPVPVGSGEAQLSYTLPPQLPFGVWELYDVQGQKVRYQVLPAGSSPSQIQTLDLSGLPSGMYVWRLALPGGYEQYEASGKLVVE